MIHFLSAAISFYHSLLQQILFSVYAHRRSVLILHLGALFDRRCLRKIRLRLNADEIKTDYTFSPQSNPLLIFINPCHLGLSVPLCHTQELPAIPLVKPDVVSNQIKRSYPL